ncbi:PH domain-containing protein [Streptomyces sp. NPDC058240]|uniref:PH domain-containing protein n=1 Tax=Streptomyces sp. NPDC058240 TaxID=3346396 RepID=UPI0036E614F2
MVTTRVSADAYGVHTRTLLRRRSVPWHDIAGLRILLKHESNSRVPESRRVGLALRDGRRRLLPLPQSWSPDDRAEFDAEKEREAGEGVRGRPLPGADRLQPAPLRYPHRPR